MTYRRQQKVSRDRYSISTIFLFFFSFLGNLPVWETNPLFREPGQNWLKMPRLVLIPLKLDFDTRTKPKIKQHAIVRKQFCNFFPSFVVIVTLIIRMGSVIYFNVFYFMPSFLRIVFCQHIRYIDIRGNIRKCWTLKTKIHSKVPGS